MTEYDPNFPNEMKQVTPADPMDFIPDDGLFTDAQRSYLNGLFAGLHQVAQAAKAGSAEAELTPLSIFFGSQTGTAESLCKALRKFAGTKGFSAKIAELNTITPAELAGLSHALIVSATHGEGEPPDNAAVFYDALMAEDCAALPASLNFAVCGLGDSSYPMFNKAATDIDARMADLGATRVVDLVTCDVDYDDDFAAWKDAVFAAPAIVEAAGEGGAVAPAEPEDARPEFDKDHPFLGTLITTECLSKSGSAKRVNHVEISLCGGGPDLDYQVGDALGLWPLNCMETVDAVLQAAGFTGKEIVELKKGPASLRQALFSMLDITVLSPKTAEAWGVTAQEDTQIIDALRGGVDGLTAQGLVDGLRPLLPRLYSISSSPKAHPGEVHLTVGEVRYALDGTARKGVASTFLAERIAAGGACGVYVQKAGHFHLPQDDNTPLIMIGPGTGIAPFRAFLEEREARGAQGENWLFFGDQHAATDFLYEDQVKAWEASGLLTKLSLAWSRDGADKVYVQHLIEQSGAAFFDWLEKGAAIYVCGDATRMAADVDAAIHQVVAAHGGMDADGASAYVTALKASGRYQRDVY